MKKMYLIMPDKIGKVNRNIYGHFTEHNFSQEKKT